MTKSVFFTSSPFGKGSGRGMDRKFCKGFLKGIGLLLFLPFVSAAFQKIAQAQT